MIYVCDDYSEKSHTYLHHFFNNFLRQLKLLDIVNWMDF